MGLLPVEEALARVLAGVAGPVEAESVEIAAGAGRTLAEPIAALRTQPPFPASAMDGYALRAADLARVPARLQIIGRSVAGAGFAGALGADAGGAHLHRRADARRAPMRSAIQEDADAEGEFVLVRSSVAAGRHVRAAGLDFVEGGALLEAGHRLDARTLALAAAAGHARLPVRRKPRVAILATGDELVRPGEPAGPDQIVASNPYALAAIVEPGRRRADRSRHRAGHAGGARPCDRRGSRAGRRHARHTRGRIGRGSRSRPGGARAAGHDARILEGRVASGETAYPRSSRRHAHSGAAGKPGLVHRLRHPLRRAGDPRAPGRSARRGRSDRAGPPRSRCIRKRSAPGLHAGDACEELPTVFPSRLHSECRIPPCSASSPAPTRSSSVSPTRQRRARASAAASSGSTNSSELQHRVSSQYSSAPVLLRNTSGTGTLFVLCFKIAAGAGGKSGHAYVDTQAARAAPVHSRAAS